MEVDTDTPAKAAPDKTNAELVEEAKNQDEIFWITNCASYKDEGDLNGPWRLVSFCPIRVLRDQKYGGPYGGFYRDNCRSNLVTSLKLWHMS